MNKIKTSLKRRVEMEIPMPHDLRDVKAIEVLIDSKTKRFWINVDGACVLRIQGFEAFKIQGDAGICLTLGDLDLD